MENREMTMEEAENDFREKAAAIFLEKIHGAYVDDDGFIVIPRRRRIKRCGNDEGSGKEGL